ncbi:MAG: hypothetical protein WAV31_04820 [Candidatus Moraniibacteriota bacterium]
MLKKSFHLLILLTIPIFPVLAKTAKATTPVSDIFRQSLIPGILSALELLWPYIILVTLVSIIFNVLDSKINKKIDSWKNNRRNGKR